ncbi:hypothetical protein [Enterococcus faecalis]|uniref:hypothetical protein n=1 Tax=Enterococcus faecalis TaxID=1351 RepID=UPI0034CD48AC
MSELTKLQKISALSKDLMNKKMNDTDRFVHLSHIYELAEDLQPELNENQQIVLDWLECYTEREAVTPIDAVARFWRERNELGQPSSWRLNGKQQAQVLQAFSRWAIEQEEG